MEQENKNAPAFAAGGDLWTQHGLTKLEYFTAMAMQGMVANPLYIDIATKNNWKDDRIGKHARDVAEATLKSLES